MIFNGRIFIFNAPSGAFTQHLLNISNEPNLCYQRDTLSDSTESLHFNEDSSFTPNYGYPKRKDTPFLEATFYP
ncbi:hypothetical protein HMPREF1869_01079 [Bacteroidales bacterium KA00251]|nr:hypothetical protein HMPREF1869_01079 [Bacteroidales bacterium KA00251]